MAFTAQDVKKLREMTNVGMMDCKKALQATDGDMDKAVDWLREKGLAKAAKKAGRVAAEGVAYAAVIDGVGVVIEVNSETDFAAKTDAFLDLVKNLAVVVAKQNPADVEALKACKYPNSDLTVTEIMQEKVMSIGENMQIRRFARFDANTSVAYVHAGGTHGVLVNLALVALVLVVIGLIVDVGLAEVVLVVLNGLEQLFVLALLLFVDVQLALDAVLLPLRVGLSWVSDSLCKRCWAWP